VNSVLKIQLLIHINSFFFIPFLLYSQTTINFSQKISINANNKSLDEILNEIEQKGNIHFSLSNEKVLTSQKLSIHAKNKSIEDIIKDICSQLNLEYAVVEKQIILKPPQKQDVSNEKTHAESKTENLRQTNKFTISGYLSDKNSRELLIGANISVNESKYGTTTNAYGFYSITLAEGAYNMEISFLGYEKQNIDVQLFSDLRINTGLSATPIQLKSAEVVHDVQLTILQQSQMSEANLRQQDIKLLPVFMGESDVIKSLQTLPGIKGYGDGSAYFYVRGGEKDQNLILLDEAPIYNPSHLLGFFSSFSSDAIKDIEVYKADIPVYKESGLSSLVDIRTKDGNMDHFSINGGIGPIASRIAIEGPFKKEKSSYFISSRRSNLEWIISPISQKTYNLYFYDFCSKLNFKFSDFSRVFITLYAGKDYFSNVNTDVGKTGMSWGNNTITARWNLLFSEKLFSNTTIYASKYYYYFYLGKDNYWNEQINNLSFKSDFTHYFNPKNIFRFGYLIKLHTFNPGNLHLDEENQAFEDSIPKISQSRSREFSLYFSNEHKIGEKFSFRYGLRMNLWQNMGPTTYYTFDDNYMVSDTIQISGKDVYYSYFNPEPRVSLAYSIDSFSSIKASYERTAQYLHLLSNLNSPFTSLDVWLPSGPNIKPQLADQIALGYYRNFKKYNLNFNVEAYYKWLYNQIDYEDHAGLLLNPLLEGELRFGEARAYGIEFLLNKSIGHLNGSLAYTLSKTISQTDDINNGNSYVPYYDRPHDIAFTLNYQTKKRWTFSSCFYYSTGSPITTPTSFYYYQGNQIPVYAEKNNERLPDYHRLDLSASFRINKNPEKKYKHSLTFSIYNVYNHKNPFTTTFNKTENDDGNFMIPMNVLSEAELIPTQMSLLGIVPSIQYNFSWK
jgi:hypothetical protein